MNCLNSLILEGTISDVVSDDLMAKKVICFTIEVTRTYKNVDGESVTNKFKFPVRAYGDNFYNLKDHFTNGRGIRIVGRLETEEIVRNNKPETVTVIIVEHLEFKPKIETANKE